MARHEKEENVFFYIGWGLLALLLLARLILRIFPIPLEKILLPCVVNQLFGLYCPGCGGTRGDFLASLRYHPLVFYVGTLGSWFLISQSIERLSGHRLKIGMKYRDAYLWIALILLVLNFLLKNLLLIVWNIDLL